MSTAAERRIAGAARIILVLVILAACKRTDETSEHGTLRSAAAISPIGGPVLQSASDLFSPTGGYVAFSESPITVKPPVAQRIDPMNTPGFEPGNGYDALTGKSKNACIEVPHDASHRVVLPPTDLGQHTDYYFHASTSSYEMAESSTWSAAASLGLGIFQGSAGARKARATNEKSYNAHYAGEVVVENEANSVPTPYSLTVAARDALRKGAEDFYAVCGTRFISGEVRGGRLSGRLTADALSASENSQLSGEIGAKFGGLLGGSAEFSEASSLVRSRTNRDLVVTNYGGAFDGVKDGQSFEDALTNFSASVKPDKHQAWLIYRSLHDYSDVGLAPGDARLRQRLREASMQRQEEYLADLAQRLEQAYGRAAEIRYVQQNPAEFAKTMGALSTNGVDDVIKELESLVSQCVADPTRKCKKRPGLKLPDSPPPSAMPGSRVVSYLFPDGSPYEASLEITKTGIFFHHKALGPGGDPTMAWMCFIFPGVDPKKSFGCAFVIPNPGAGPRYRFGLDTWVCAPGCFLSRKDAAFTLRYLDTDGKPSTAKLLEWNGRLLWTISAPE